MTDNSYLSFLADFTFEVCRAEDETHLRLIGTIWREAIFSKNAREDCAAIYTARRDALRYPEAIEE